ncbi:uncharacterized protein HD556DRAFT_1446068 [Suillus plorans]|uniref:Uncharacterized protein n=1 Tax=Suillus plorans TaxID=116603 RepID=A0A9P7AKR1_9AGAM|nr:uncharacterized protein HD556DRAFT_1446068 [Suillus plorans]KAG1790546.1 hypothetical protein HD556DRAFT_1446068 [Suillus plorans]
MSLAGDQHQSKCYNGLNMKPVMLLRSHLSCFRASFIDVVVLTLVPSLAKIAHMDFARLYSVLNHIALQCRVTAETVLAEWLERQEVADPEHWKQLSGIPCITGGLIALLGTLNGRGGMFPWKKLSAILTCHGYTLHHYPKNVLMPSKRRPTLTKRPTRQCPENKFYHHPAEVPQWDLQNLHGRHAFLNGRTNRKGLPHVKMAETSPEPSSETSVVLSLPVPSRQLRRRILQVLSPEDSPVPSPIPSHHHSPAVSPAPLHRPKVQVFVELPHAPPSWRLKATQQHSSPVSRPETNMLIPQINYLSQLSVTMDGIFNEEEETDKVLTWLTATVAMNNEEEEVIGLVGSLSEVAV